VQAALQESRHAQILQQSANEHRAHDRVRGGHRESEDVDGDALELLVLQVHAARLKVGGREEQSDDGGQPGGAAMQDEAGDQQDLQDRADLGKGKPEQEHAKGDHKGGVGRHQ
jgi:hypothetical protein